ncbi:T9SS type A sorting domain-containing protein [Flavobacterium sp.]|uniref:T9SS type A sorting domain-containing protein n=1 Tax=Flavobacterium sp. TaxID=239 RepID=UPI0025F1A9C2|nr:T9SS type A sorting domain-containing protein [Flavobacterium sp.]
MKKITLLLLLPFLGFSQSKVSNTVSVSNSNVTILLDNDTQTATLTLVGPSDRWLAAQFGSFSGGMEAGSDVVYYNGTVLVDATHGGIGVAPTADAQNNWTVATNTVASGVRTIVATRPFNSPDATDYDFNYNNTTIGIALAQGNSASFSLAYHGAANRISNTAVPFTTLGVEDFSLNATQIYPNPSNGDFSIQLKTSLTQVNIYSQTGAFVKTIKVEESDSATVSVNGLSTGVYLLELVNNTNKAWKKVIIK